MKSLKKTLSVITVLVLALAVTLTGCGGGGGESTASSEPSADSLNILIYPDYVDEEILDRFSEETGIQVNYTYLEAEEDNQTKLEAGDDFDIVQPCQETAHMMIEEGLLAEIDKDNIPNLQYLYDEFNTYDFPGEENYSIPYMCGSMSIIINKDTCPIEIDSWSDLADPALKGQIVSTDIDRRFVATTLAENGYDPNSTKQEDLDAVFDWLVSFNNNVKAYDNGAPRTALENGECSVAYTYTTEWILINEEMPDGNWELVTFPNGNYSRGEWMFAIPASSKKKEQAEQLINYILDPENYAENLMMYPGIPVVEASLDYLTDEYKDYIKAFEFPETANVFTLEPLSTEDVEKYDLLISNVMAAGE